MHSADKLSIHLGLTSTEDLDSGIPRGKSDFPKHMIELFIGSRRQAFKFLDRISEMISNV